MKSKYHNRPVPERLGTAKGFFETSKKDPEALEILSKRSFNAGKMALGFSYYEEAQAEFAEQQESISGKKETGSEYRTELDALAKKFSELFRYSKVALENNKEALYMLGLNKERENTTIGIFNELNQYFANVFSSELIVQKIGEYGYSKDDLITFKTNYERIYQVYLTYKKEQTESMEKTEKKDEKMAKLDKFMNELITVTKIIEETVPNFSKRIGLIL